MVVLPQWNDSFEYPIFLADERDLTVEAGSMFTTRGTTAPGYRLKI